MRFKDDFIRPGPDAGELTMTPCFSACDACGEPFTSVGFGGRGNMDTALYELCVGCVARIVSLYTTAPDSAELAQLTERVRWAMQLREARTEGSA